MTTSALRQADKGELDTAKPVMVELAVGEVELWMTSEATLVPMACLPALGCALSWNDKGISVRHPEWGLLPVKLRGACPEIPSELAVTLIHAFESMQREKASLRLQKIQLWHSSQTDQEVPSSKDALQWLAATVESQGCSNAVQLESMHKMFPELPTRVVCEPSFNACRVPFNRRVRRRLFDASVPTLLHLFAGEQHWKGGPGQVLSIDLKSGGDLLSDDVFGMVLKAAVGRTVSGALAGPPCRTTSACRHADDNGPRPIRARQGPQRFGLSTNTDVEAELVSNDTVLWFRTLLLFSVLHVCSPVRPFLGWEHPADPATWAPAHSPLQCCPSVWCFPEFGRVMQALDMWQADFDQGIMGHARRKPTSMMLTSWSVYEALHECRGPGVGEALARTRSPEGV